MKKLNNYLIVLLLLVLSTSTLAQINILLRKSFIDSVKNHVLIEADYFVVKMHAHPNSPSDDGDIHIAGYSNRIGLPVVSEIMNAKDEKDAVDTMRSYEGENRSVHIAGAWRIWCEHTGSDTQDQGAPIPPITNTNPDHVFEIHPVTMVKDKDIISSLRGIQGYTYKDADRAFNRYAKASCRLEDRNDKVFIETKGVGYNYAEYNIEILDTSQFVTNDGRFVFCKVKDNDGKTIYSKMRMAFPEGSAAELAVKDLSKGDAMHVLGIPRIDLALISYRINHAQDKPFMLEWNLPVEMIVVADLGN